MFSHFQGISFPVLSRDLRKLLVHPFMAEVVVEAVKQLDPLKAPGADCIPTLFCQSFWSITDTSVVNVVLSFLNQGHFLRKLNACS